MKIDLCAALANSYRGLVSIERTFVVVVAATGLLIILMASSLFLSSQNDLFHQYIIAQKSYKARLAQEKAETVEMVNGLINSSSVQEGNVGRGGREPSPSPVTIPLWKNVTARPVKPFLPGKPQQHPYMRDYVIKNMALCQNSSVDLLIVIHSAVKHFQKRRILRETWTAAGSLQGITIKRIFLLGRDGSNSSCNASQVAVNTEQATYGDIVQGDFVDSLPNLTLKAVTGLRWINDFCSHARFVLKADDDLFVNMFRLVESFLPMLAGLQQTVMCHMKPVNSSRIERNPSSKWYVPPSLLVNRTHWPAFCSGYLVVMTTDVVPDLYRASFKAPYVPVDDGYVYGILPLEVGEDYLRYIDISRNLTLSEDKLMRWYGNASLPLSFVGGTVRSEVSLTRLWQAAVFRMDLWARQRASIVKLQSTMSPTTL